MQCLNCNDIEKATIRSLANTFEIKRNIIYDYMNKGFTRLQIINELVTGCYINLFGQIVIPDKYSIDKLKLGIIVFNKHFRSKNELANYYKINVDTLNYRVSKGYSIEEAIVYNDIKEIKRLRKQANIEVDSYINVNETKKEIKRLNKLIEQHKKKMELEEEEQIKLEEEHKKLLNDKEQWEKENGEVPIEKAKYIAFGKRFTSIKYLSNYFNINQDAVYGAINRGGYTLEDAIIHLLGKYEINGKRYRSLKEVGKEYNISESSLRDRLKKGMSLESAVLLEKSTKYNSIPVSYKGVNYKSLNNACTSLRVSRASIQKYLDKGYTFEQSVDMYKIRENERKQEDLKRKQENNVESKKRKNCIDIEINGIAYNNIKEACKQLGLSDSTVRKYVRDTGKSHKEVIEQMLVDIKQGKFRVNKRGLHRNNEKQLAINAGLSETSIACYRHYHQDYSTPAETIVEHLLSRRK